MQEIIPNPWALSACVVLRMAVGALWYSPPVFLKPWMKMSGVSPKQMQAGMLKALVSDLLLSLLMAFVLLHAIRYALGPLSRDLGQGLAVAFFNWAGLVLPVQWGIVTYEHKPFKYFAIVSGYQLLTLLGMGAILTLWG